MNWLIEDWTRAWRKYNCRWAMPTVVTWVKKRDALIISSINNQSNKKLGVALTALANITIHNPIKKGLD